MVLWVLGLLLAVGPAVAVAMVDSPQLEEVTCQGLRVRQTGLPASTALVVEVSDPQSGRQLARQEARSDAAGLLDIRIVAPFDAARQLAVEVESEREGQEVELAEAVHEFDRPCPDGEADRSSAGRAGMVMAAAVTVAVLVAGLVAGGRALRPPQRPGDS
jgi:hypothetical protein